MFMRLRLSLSILPATQDGRQLSVVFAFPDVNFIPVMT